MASIISRRIYIVLACAITLVLSISFLHKSSNSLPGFYHVTESFSQIQPQQQQQQQQRPARVPAEIHTVTKTIYQHELPTTAPGPMSLEKLIQEIYQPLKPALDVESFQSLDGKEYSLSGPTTWTKPLGKELCIIDVDDRRMDNENEFLSPNPLNWANFHGYGAGVMNHYLYSLIHGYTYKFIQNAGYPDRKGSWSKMSALLDLLQEGKCRFILLIDADATMTNLELPFEWLMNRWQINSTTALALPRDPLNNEPNYDSKGRLNVNTGFVLTQRIPVSETIIEEIIACPNNTDKYPDCARFKYEGFCEQGALSEYVRYQFPSDILELECNDVNGYPGSGRPCNGVFANHHWDRKYMAKDSLVESFITNLVMRLKTNMLQTPGVASLLPIERPMLQE